MKEGVLETTFAQSCTNNENRKNMIFSRLAPSLIVSRSPTAPSRQFLADSLLPRKTLWPSALSSGPYSRKWARNLRSLPEPERRKSHTQWQETAPC